MQVQYLTDNVLSCALSVYSFPHPNRSSEVPLLYPVRSLCGNYKASGHRQFQEDILPSASGIYNKEFLLSTEPVQVENNPLFSPVPLLVLFPFYNGSLQMLPFLFHRSHLQLQPLSLLLPAHMYSISPALSCGVHLLCIRSQQTEDVLLHRPVH